jgi:hypothetical protein
VVEQGRQDLNLQPPVLETGALPIELRPWAASGIVSAAFRHHLSVSTIEDDDGPSDDEDELLEEQEHKGYGDDEGERDSSFDDDDAE